MADNEINVNNLPVKTAPEAGSKMMMIGPEEEYQIDYDQLASAILNKLSTQNFSSLDTTSKTVLGAIDELNSKSKNTYFQLKHNVEGNSEEAIDEFYDNYSKNLYSDTLYFARISHDVAHPILKGGIFALEGFKATNSYEWQITTTYSSSGGISRFCRSKINGEWKDWTPR